MNRREGIRDTSFFTYFVVVLGVGYTKVTDAGLKELKDLKQLTSLDLGRTKVTDAGVKELQSALPRCKITR